MFRAIQLERQGLASSANTFATCFGSSYCRVHETCNPNVGGLTYLYLHLYNHMTNPTDHCCFPYLANFMSTIVGLVPISSPSISSHGELDRPLFLFILNEFYARGCRVGAIELCCNPSIGGLTYLYLHLYNHTTNLTHRCCFPYLANFMSTIVGLAPISSPSISSHGELDRPLFLFILSEFYAHGC
jgi:hypothetical protein